MDPAPKSPFLLVTPEEKNGNRRLCICCVVGLILFAGYEIIKAVFVDPSRPLPRQLSLSMAGIGATILITWLFARYEFKKGRETGSPSLIADARHIWIDMLSSLVILMALLGSAIGFAIDKYAAVIVVIFIAQSAIVILLGSVRVLLDASLDYIDKRLLKNPYLHEEKAKGIKVAKWLLENGMDVLLSHQDQSGKGPGFVLGNAGAEILFTKETNAEKALAIAQSDQRKTDQEHIDSETIREKREAMA